jgi:hypothetical protein
MNEKTIKIFAWVTFGLAAFVLLWDASKPPQGMSKVSASTAYQTIPLAPLPSVVTPPVTTLPVTTCAQALNLALSVGWSADQTPTLSRVLFRESRCQENAFNPQDTVGKSYGLLQINSFWCTPSAYWPQGWLQAKGILTVCESLLDPKINLTAGLAIWHNSNWSPWGFSQ